MDEDGAMHAEGADGESVLDDAEGGRLTAASDVILIDDSEDFPPSRPRALGSNPAKTFDDFREHILRGGSGVAVGAGAAPRRRTHLLPDDSESEEEDIPIRAPVRAGSAVALVLSVAGGGQKRPRPSEGHEGAGGGPFASPNRGGGVSSRYFDDNLVRLQQSQQAKKSAVRAAVALGGTAGLGAPPDSGVKPLEPFSETKAAAGSAVEPVGTSFDDVIMIESQTAGSSSSPSDSSSSSSGSGTSSSSSSDSGIVSVVVSPMVAGPAPVGYVLDEDGAMHAEGADGESVLDDAEGGRLTAASDVILIDDSEDFPPSHPRALGSNPAKTFDDFREHILRGGSGVAVGAGAAPRRRTHLLPDDSESEEEDIPIRAPVRAGATVEAADRAITGLCPVCRDELDNVEDVGRLGCGHAYCLDCILKWADVTNHCCLCKAAFSAIRHVSRDVTRQQGAGAATRPRLRSVVIKRVDAKRQRIVGMEDEDERLAIEMGEEEGDGEYAAEYEQEGDGEPEQPGAASAVNWHCKECNKDDNDAELLMCDACDSPHHMRCHDPPLAAVPEGLWLCSVCELEKQYYEDTDVLTRSEYVRIMQQSLADKRVKSGEGVSAALAAAEGAGAGAGGQRSASARGGLGGRTRSTAQPGTGAGAGAGRGASAGGLRASGGRPARVHAARRLKSSSRQRRDNFITDEAEEGEEEDENSTEEEEEDEDEEEHSYAFGGGARYSSHGYMMDSFVVAAPSYRSGEAGRGEPAVTRRPSASLSGGRGGEAVGPAGVQAKGRRAAGAGSAAGASAGQSIRPAPSVPSFRSAPPALPALAPSGGRQPSSTLAGGGMGLVPRGSAMAVAPAPPAPHHASAHFAKEGPAPAGSARAQQQAQIGAHKGRVEDNKALHVRTGLALAPANRPVLAAPAKPSILGGGYSAYNQPPPAAARAPGGVPAARRVGNEVLYNPTPSQGGTYHGIRASGSASWGRDNDEVL